MVRYGRGRLRLLLKHPDTFSLASLAPALLVQGLIAGAVLACVAPAFALAYAALVGAYAAVLGAASAALAVRECRPGLLLWLPPVFAAIHLGAGVGLLWEMFARPARGRRES
jgi:hypothetical protein